MPQAIPPSTDPIGRVLHSLRELNCNPRPSGSGWAARCPAHEDSTPSLSIRKGDVHPVILNCHAGCRPDEVLRALGLTWRELFPTRDGATYTPPTRQPAAKRPERQPESLPDEHYAKWADIAAAVRRTTTSDRVAQLAALLDVSIESLEMLQVGWVDAEQLSRINGKPVRGPAWLFPMVCGAGRVIGMGARTESGGKWYVAGSKNGLFAPSNLGDLPDPVYVPEGASDTAAALTLGYAAVGRPSNMLGADRLRDLLRGRQVVIVGENDRKADTGNWPGKEGAMHVARQLSAAWRMRVCWMLPPPGFKDLRAWSTHRRSLATSAQGAVTP